MLAGSSEDVRDDVVRVNAIYQPCPVVVDEPAGHLSPMPGVPAVVFLQAPKKIQKAGVTFWSQQGCTTPPEAHSAYVTPEPQPMMGTLRAEIPEKQPTYLVTVSWWLFTTIVASVFVGSEPGRGSDTL